MIPHGFPADEMSVVREVVHKEIYHPVAAEVSGFGSTFATLDTGNPDPPQLPRGAGNLAPSFDRIAVDRAEAVQREVMKNF